MNRLERMTLIKLAVRDLNDAVNCHDPVKYENEKWCSTEAIKRKIITIRNDLKMLERELDNECLSRVRPVHLPSRVPESME